VFFIIICVYFFLASMIAWMVLFPSGRERVMATLGIVGSKLERRLSRIERQASTGTTSAVQRLRSKLIELNDLIFRHYLLSLSCLFIVAVPPLMALILSQKNQLDGFDTSTREINTQVAALLTGEQLVAPAPLPPMIFLTKEIAQERPMLGSASRDWALLNTDFRQRLLMVFKLMKERHGYEMALIEGYRSPERQDLLAKLGSNVTNASAFQSFHQFGMAADCAFLQAGGLVISEKNPWAMRGYELFGELAESTGLVWGGRWKNMDFGHIELRTAGLLKKK
jgi:peptidoglycan L-alanyl-D-glutamate endopeptidase CwlK